MTPAEADKPPLVTYAMVARAVERWLQIARRKQQVGSLGLLAADMRAALTAALTAEATEEGGR